MIQNKKILVTGATSGIGYGLCRYLLENNCKVLAVGRDVRKLDDLASKYIDNLKIISLDLTEYSNYNKIFEVTLSGEKLDGFVHCAGMEETLPITLYTQERIKKIYEIKNKKYKNYRKL